MFRNVTIVCPPALTITVAVRAARLLLTSSPLGKVLTDVSTVPVVGGVSVSVMIVGPTGTCSAGLQLPPGEAPAVTVIPVGGLPAMVNVKFVPTATPAPAILQIWRKPVVETLVLRNVAIVCPPGLTVTVTVRAPRSLLTSNPPGKVLTAVSTVSLADGVSVMNTEPAGTSSGVLQEPNGAAPAGTVITVGGFPATLNPKFIPSMPAFPATLQIWRKPVVGTTTALVNVAIVSPPGLTVTVAVRAPKSLLTSDKPGNALTAVNTDRVSDVGRVSAMIVCPTGTSIAVLQEPAGAGPAGTVPPGIGVPLTLNAKFAPATTPLPATLQIWRNPVVGTTAALVNVTIVCPPTLTVTVAVPKARLLLTSNPALGSVRTSVSMVPAGKVSAIRVCPAGTSSGTLQEPDGAGPAGNGAPGDRSSINAEREVRRWIDADATTGDLADLKKPRGWRGRSRVYESGDRLPPGSNRNSSRARAQIAADQQTGAR